MLLISNVPSHANFHQLFTSNQQTVYQIQKSIRSIRNSSTKRHLLQKPSAPIMCLYNTSTFECGCESQPPIFLSPCASVRSSRCCSHPGCDRHHHRCRQSQSCTLFLINQEKTTPGKCPSHRFQAQMERKIRELKDEIKHLKDDIAEYQYDIDQAEARRTREQQGLKGKHRGHFEWVRRRSVRA